MKKTVSTFVCFGPWATSIADKSSPQLSVFWERRLLMLRQAKRVRPLTTRHVFWLGAATLVICAFPTFYLASAMAQEDADKANPTKSPRNATGAATREPAATAPASPWEYKVVSPWDGKPVTVEFTRSTDEEEAAKKWQQGLATLEKWLNDHGKEGWELVSVDQQLNRYIFKRLRKSTPRSRFPLDDLNSLEVEDLKNYLESQEQSR